MTITVIALDRDEELFSGSRSTRTVVVLRREDTRTWPRPPQPSPPQSSLADQAGWHLSTRLLVPPIFTIIQLPSKCPELNPVESVWQFMRDNGLSNRVFNPTTISSTIVVQLGTGSATNPGASCPSDCANGRTGSDQWDSVQAIRLFQSSKSDEACAACRASLWTISITK